MSENVVTIDGYGAASVTGHPDAPGEDAAVVMRLPSLQRAEDDDYTWHIVMYPAEAVALIHALSGAVMDAEP